MNERDIIKRLKAANKRSKSGPKLLRKNAQSEANKLRNQLSKLRKSGGTYKGARPSSGGANVGTRRLGRRRSFDPKTGKRNPTLRFKGQNDDISLTPRAAKDVAGIAAKNGAKQAKKGVKNAGKVTKPKKRGGGGGGSGGGGGGGGGGAAPNASPASTPSALDFAMPGASSASLGDVGYTEYEPFKLDALYAPAFRELQRQQRIADVGKKAKEADLSSFNNWFAQQREKAMAQLQSGQNTAAGQAAASREAGSNKFKEYVAAAQAAMGGKSSLAESTGLNAAMERTAALDTGTAAEAAANASSGQAHQERLDSERQVADASAKQLLEAYNAQHSQQQSQIAGQRTQLEFDLGQAKHQERVRTQMLNEQAKAAYNQSKIDSALADFTNQYKMAQLGLEDRKLTIAERNNQSKAQLQAMRLDLQEKVEDGKLSLGQARLQFQRQAKRADLSSKEKDRQIKVGLAQLKASGSTSNNLNKVARDYVTQVVEPKYGKSWNQLANGSEDINATRDLVQMLASESPGASRAQISQTIAGIAGNQIANDPRIKQAIADAGF